MKLKINFARGRQRLSEMHRHAIFRQIHQRRFLVLSAGIVDRRLGVYRRARLAALVPVQHYLGRFQAAHDPVVRQRLIQHEVDP